MALGELMWLAVAAYGLHILKEHALDWRGWARAVMKLPVEWADFYVVNSLVIVLGIVAAELVPTAPMLALSFPALMLINAVFFHILPFIRTRGRFSPGLATPIVLFLPLGLACYWQAGKAGVGAGAMLVSLLIGAALMASPVVLLLVHNKPYFRQDR